MVTSESSSAAPPRLGYRPSLDGLRGIAVISVVAFHEVGFFYSKHEDSVLAGGFFGVDIFFVLSGFLITTLLMEEARGRGSIDLVAFWVRRGARLFPAMYAYLAAATFYSVVIVGLGRSTALQSDISAAFYYLNWRKAAGAELSPAFSHLWSLAVEEQFYLLWPVVIVVVLRFLTPHLGAQLSKALLPCLVAVLIIASAVSRAVIWSRDPDPSTVIYYTNFHSDQLLLGALGAFVFTSSFMKLVTAVRRGVWIPAAATMVLAILFVPQSSSFLYRGGYVVFGVAAVLLVLCALESSELPGRWLAHPALVFVGRISYALYLWHFGIITFFAYVLGGDLPLLGVVASAVSAFAVAVASTFLLELPVRRWVQARMRRRPVSSAVEV